MRNRDPLVLVLIFGQSAATWYVWLPLPVVETPASFDRPVRLPPGAAAAPLLMPEPAAIQSVWVADFYAALLFFVNLIFSRSLLHCSLRSGRPRTKPGPKLSPCKLVNDSFHSMILANVCSLLTSLMSSAIAIVAYRPWRVEVEYIFIM